MAEELERSNASQDGEPIIEDALQAQDPSAEGAPSDQDHAADAAQAQGASVDDAQRARVQNRRAAWAVAIMALISVVLIAAVEFMYYAADKMNEPEQAKTVVPIAIQSVVDKKNEIYGTEPTDPFYVLLIGSDSRKGTALYTGKSDSHAQVDQHSDVMTLLRVDPSNYVLTFVSIPRDTQLEGSKGKLCDTLRKGDPQDVVDAVERLTGVEIEHYMMTGFTGFEDMVDAMNGVMVDVPVSATLVDPKTTKKVSIDSGEGLLLDGSQSLVLARARGVYEDKQDAYRQINVRNLEIGLVERACIFYTPETIGSLVSNLSQNVTTSMDDGLIAVLAKDFLENSSLITFYSCTGPYEGDVNSKGLWVVPEDKEAWSALMAAVDAGGDPALVEEPLTFED